MIGLFLLSIGIISTILILIRIHWLMRWHALIVDKFYEFYDGDSSYNLPPGRYVFTDNVDFGKHNIVLQVGGAHEFVGKDSAALSYSGDESLFDLTIEDHYILNDGEEFLKTTREYPMHLRPEYGEVYLKPNDQTNYLGSTEITGGLHQPGSFFKVEDEESDDVAT